MPEFITALHAIEELLKRGTMSADLIVDEKRARVKSRIRRLVRLAEREDIPIAFSLAREMDRTYGKGKHRGVVLIVRDSSRPFKSPGSKSFRFRSLKTLLADLKDPTALLIVLDGITDPHNLGAILRSADQFGVDAVVVQSHRSARESEAVAVVSAGASAWVTVTVESNIRNAIDLLKKHGFWVYGAHMGGQPVMQAKLQGKIAIVLGSEGKGLRRLVQDSCDELISIPSSGHIDSFNVSVAAGILMYEIRRQQGYFNRSSTAKSQSSRDNE
jgi:23S rRNA (guanosine2251-2'-O)-methyltransferase